MDIKFRGGNHLFCIINLNYLMKRGKGWLVRKLPVVLIIFTYLLVIFANLIMKTVLFLRLMWSIITHYLHTAKLVLPKLKID